LAVTDAFVLNADRDHHRVVMAVVGAEDLADRLAPRIAARDPDRVHRRLRARVDLAPPLEAPAALQYLGDDHAILSRAREVRAERDSLAHGPDDRGVGMSLDHRPEPVVKVPHAVAVDVVDRGSLPGRQVDRPGLAGLIGRPNPAAQRLARAAGHGARRARALVELHPLALGELPDALAVQSDSGVDCHLPAPMRSRPDGRCTRPGKLQVTRAAIVQFEGVSGPAKPPRSLS